MNQEGWSERERGGFRWIESGLLGDCRGVRHLFSTRRGPDGDADLGSSDAPDRRLARRLAVAAGFDGPPVSPRQVHGSRLVSPDSLPAEADGLVVGRGGPVVGIRTADCVPILFAALDGSLLIAVHAGWRGTVAGILDAALDRLAGAGVGEVRAALGPAAGGCCYEVGDDVRDAVAVACRAAPTAISRSAGRPGHAYLDLRAAQRTRLLDAGLPARALAVAPHCTICLPELFFSYRREGAAAGRSMAWGATG